MVLTKKDLDEAVEKIIKIFDDKFAGIADRFQSLEDTVQKNSREIEKQNNDLAELRSQNLELRAQLDEVNKQIAVGDAQISSSSELASKLDEIEERVEDRTNRQLRQTLVIRGLKEKNNESWEDTTESVAELISNKLKVSFNSADNMLNRVHRSRRSNDPRQRNQPRKIFAALYRWQDCERLVEEFRQLNINGRSSVRIDYMYGPKTQIRRNLALQKRKELKEAGSITSAYIAFPARLMAKRPGMKKEDNYEIVHDFSTTKVQLKSRYNADTSDD